MQIHVRYRPRRHEDQTIVLEEGATMATLMRAVGQPIDSTIAVRGGVPVAETTMLKDQDDVTLLSAISGG